jgi:zinc/manganese transport system substrate-binding protein
MMFIPGSTGRAGAEGQDTVSGPRTPRRRRRALVAAGGTALATAALLTAGCATTPPGGGPSGDTLTVVAAENFWGSIAAQLGGTRVTETSLIANPQTDPHSYEPTAADARAVSAARLFIQNGIGYDSGWAAGLVAANPSSARTVLTVGDVLGLKDGDNPHQWYSHQSVYAVIDAITADYQKIDPSHAAYYAQRKSSFENDALAEYNALEQTIRAKYAGTAIGASESIVSPLADSLGLDLVTPYSFLRDISEGNDPTTADKTLIDQQIQSRRIKVYVYNSQNSTPDIQAQVTLARQEGIPVTTVTETLSPEGDTFQQWMVAQLRGLEKALAEGTGH